MISRLAFPELDVQPVAFAVVGMAAFFTAVVRAPVTGIVLIIEMTASFSMFLPMLAACFKAMLVPTLLGEAPIYNSLRRRQSNSRLLHDAHVENRGDGNEGAALRHL